MTETPIPPVVQGYEIIWSGFSAPSDDDDSFFPDQNYNEWPSVEISFGDPATRYVQTVSAKVMGYTESKPDSGDETKRNYFDVAYQLKKMELVSCNTGDTPDGGCVNTPWEYGETPERYGGIYMNEPNTPQNKGPGQLSSCSTEGGVVNGNQSGYIYTDVFYKTELTYLPMNHNKSEGRYGGPLNISGRDPLRTEPLYPDVKDPHGKAAPIYPMDAISAFLPDDRDQVWIKYTVTMEAKVINGPFGNPNLSDTITIAHKVTQNSGSYGDKLQELLRLCMISNPGDIPEDQLSPGYMKNYPYTIVSEGAPSQRETYGDPDGDLQKGDVWYDPGSGKRKYFNVNDVPKDLIISNKGKNYKTANNVDTVFTPPEEEKCEPRDGMTSPYGLTVDIVANDKGEVTSVKMTDTDYNQATKFNDGDVVNIVGGNGAAQITIKIDGDQNVWTDEFIGEL